MLCAFPSRGNNRSTQYGAGRMLCIWMFLPVKLYMDYNSFTVVMHVNASAFPSGGINWLLRYSFWSVVHSDGNTCEITEGAGLASGKLGLDHILHLNCCLDRRSCLDHTTLELLSLIGAGAAWIIHLNCCLDSRHCLDHTTLELLSWQEQELPGSYYTWTASN